MTIEWDGDWQHAPLKEQARAKPRMEKIRNAAEEFLAAYDQIMPTGRLDRVHRADAASDALRAALDEREGQ